MMQTAYICDQCRESMSLTASFNVEWLLENNDLDKLEWLFCSSICVWQFFQERRHLE